MERVRRILFLSVFLLGLTPAGAAAADPRLVSGSGGGFGLFLENGGEGLFSDAEKTREAPGAGLHLIFQPLEYAIPSCGGSVGLVGGVKWIDDALHDKAEDHKMAESVGPIPVVGLNFSITLLEDHVRARVLAAGMSGNGHRSAFAGQAELSFTPHPDLYISGGYHVFSLDMTSDGMKLTLDEVVPYISLTLNF